MGNRHKRGRDLTLKGKWQNKETLLQVETDDSEKEHAESISTNSKQNYEALRMSLTFISCPLENNSGLCNGSITNSFKVSLTFSSAPMSPKVTPISSGGITSLRSLFSSSFSVATS
jgi:hypothetical protein